MSRHGGSFILGAQTGQEIIHVSPGQAEDGSCAKFSAWGGDPFLCREEITQQRAVSFYNFAAAFADLVQMLQRHDAQQFGGMRRDGRKQVIQPPHGACQAGLSQDPATAQAAQAVNLGQTAGDDELRSQKTGGLRSVAVNRVEIHLVNQHARSHAAGQFADFTQHGFRSQNAAGIMQVGEHN